MANFPGSIPSYAGFTGSHTLSADNHAAQSNAEQADIIAVATKIGTGASTPASGLVLRSSVAGVSTWGQVNQTTDVTGTLPVANGGTGQANLTALPLLNPAITGVVTGGATYTNPVLTTPTIADFTNATHTHATNAQGGQLVGSNALTNSSVTADKLNTGAQVGSVVTSETTTSVTYTDLATVGPTATVTIGANGLALISLSADMLNATLNKYTIMGFVASGANTIVAADTSAYFIGGLPALAEIFAGNVFLLSGLSTGSTTFKAQYRVDGGTGTFARRRLSVIPL